MTEAKLSPTRFAMGVKQIMFTALKARFLYTVQTVFISSFFVTCTTSVVHRRLKAMCGARMIQ